MNYFRHLTASLLLLLLVVVQARAQTDPLRLKLDSVFHYVDKSQVPTGFLDEDGA